MRAVLLFVIGFLAVQCCVADATLPTAPDADDMALMELGINLSQVAEAQDTLTVPPLPSYTSVRPPGHEEALIAKFPMLHEIKGVEAQDWNDIQGLLFREPPAAAESSIDFKLDELEAKFNAIDTQPVPSGVAPKGSSLLKKVKKVEEGLAAVLPKQQVRLQQLKAQLAKADAKKAAATKPKATTAAPPAAKATAKTAKKSVAKKSSAKKSSAKKIKASASAVSTLRLIEKRLKGLQTLFASLKSQLGAGDKKKSSGLSAVDAALAKHRKDARDLKKRMAARKMRFAGLDMDAEADLAAEEDIQAEMDAESEIESEGDLEAAAAFETNSFAETESETESETETESESDAEADAELAADAEAVDEIIQTLM